MSEPIEIEAIVTEIRRPPNCGDFFLGRAKPVQKECAAIAAGFTIKGVMPEDDSPEPGLNYKLYGKWADDPKFGRQFELMTFSPAAPHGREGTILYLERNASKIGRARAVEAWNLFGPDSLRIAREHPEIFASKIRGLDIEAAKKISEELKLISSLEGVNVALLELLNGRGFPRDTARRMVKKHGNRAPEVISRNPFRLMEEPGGGFNRCDAFWESLGLPMDAMRRQVCCLQYCLQSDKEGHTWIDSQTVERFLKSKVTSRNRDGESNLDFEKALKIAVRAKKLDVVHWCDKCSSTGRALVPDLFDGEVLVDAVCPKCHGGPGQRYIADWTKSKAEEAVARYLASSYSEESHWPKLIGVEPGEAGPTRHQAEQANLSTAGTIGLLTGSPGTGKTWVVAAVVKELLKVCGIQDIAVAAPTGKAAVRCSETLAGYEIGLRAKTIHSLLKVESADGGNWQFQHRANNPLPYKFIIIDEFSMCDIPLLNSLLAARARGTHILFVGDPNQLPPVGYGCPLRDMIFAGMPCGKLVEIKRNAGTIVRACAAIRDGLPIPLDKEFDLTGDDPKNLVLRTARESEMVEVLRERIEAIQDLNPIWDVQVIVAVNKRSTVCRTKLNEYLQDLQNKHGFSLQNSPFRVGDKTIVLKNSILPKEGSPNIKIAIANGEFGAVRRVEEKRTIVKFPSNESTIEIARIPLKKKPSSSSNSDDDGDTKEEESATGCDMDLAYAATCHKMQGSSAKHVIVMLDPYPGATGPHGICDRSWIFTAISRAERSCELIGLYSTLKTQVAETKIWRRKTLLAQKINLYAKQVAKIACTGSASRESSSEVLTF